MSDVQCLPLILFLRMCVVNPCSIANGGCAHECVFTHVAHYCKCRLGFKLLDDRMQCEGQTLHAMDVPKSAS